MRTVVIALLGLMAVSDAARAEAWLRVADDEGRFQLEMPVPFDLSPPQVAPDGSVTVAYIHETPELVLRFEVVDRGEAVEALPAPIGRPCDSRRMVRSHVVGRRTYRAVATFRPELEGDPAILRFLQSIRYHDDPN